MRQPLKLGRVPTVPNFPNKGTVPVGLLRRQALKVGTVSISPNKDMVPVGLLRRQPLKLGRVPTVPTVQIYQIKVQYL